MGRERGDQTRDLDSLPCELFEGEAKKKEEGVGSSRRRQGQGGGGGGRQMGFSVVVLRVLEEVLKAGLYVT